MDFGPVEIGTAPGHDYSDEQIERGRFLVTFGGCNDCHTPFNLDPATGAPFQDMSRWLSGHPRNAPDPVGALAPGDMAIFGPSGTSVALPFGIVYSANLTPDLDSGTGSWSEQMFLDIFRTLKEVSVAVKRWSLSPIIVIDGRDDGVGELFRHWLDGELTVPSLGQHLDKLLLEPHREQAATTINELLVSALESVPRNHRHVVQYPAPKGGRMAGSETLDEALQTVGGPRDA